MRCNPVPSSSLFFGGMDLEAGRFVRKVFKFWDPYFIVIVIFLVDAGDRVTQTGPKLSLVWTGSLFAQCRRISQYWDAGRAPPCAELKA